MTGALTYAIQQELLAFYKLDAATILERTNFTPTKWPTYTIPLFLWEEEGGEDTFQFIGGLTQDNLIITLSAYIWAPDISGSDPTPFSASLRDEADRLRQHFSVYTNMLSQEMIDAVNTYGWKWTLSGAGKAESLEHPEGLVKGFKFTFESIALDDSTSGTLCGPGKSPPLDGINQIAPLPPAH